MTELEHTTSVQKSITSENRHKIWQPHGLLKPAKINDSKDEQSIVCFEANWKHACILFFSLGQQEHAFLGSALHFIQITWFTYVFANIRSVHNRFKFQNAA